MLILKITAIAIALITGLYLLDRLCLWAETRGWIFYRKTKASGNALGASALELQNIFESGKAKHIVAAQASVRSEDPDAGPDHV